MKKQTIENSNSSFKSPIGKDTKQDIGSFSSDSIYNRTLQGTPIHGLIASSTSPQAFQIDAITRAAKAESGGVIITVEEEALLSLSAQTFKVLIMYLTKATEQLPRGNAITAESINRGRSVKLTLSDYMEKCGIKDKKTAREQLNTAVYALLGILLEWDEVEYNIPEGKSRKVKEQRHHRMRVIDHTVTSEKGKPIKNGAAEIKLSYDMAEYLAGAYIMPYPAVLLRINTKDHPYSIPLGWKLCTLYNMNYSNPDRRNKTTVATLLRAAKGIPRYSTISAKGQIYDRIIKPFDRDMKELVEEGILSSYYYYDSNGEEIKTLASLSYSEFSELNIWYELAEYPDQTPRIEAKQKRISAAISRAQRAAARKQQQSENPIQAEGALK